MLHYSVAIDLAWILRLRMKQRISQGSKKEEREMGPGEKKGGKEGKDKGREGQEGKEKERKMQKSVHALGNLTVFLFVCLFCVGVVLAGRGGQRA